MSEFTGPGVVDHARHTPYSRPGKHAALLDEALGCYSATGLAAESVLVEMVSGLARNLVVHYRGSGEELPAATADDINLRWVEDILDTDQSRHGAPLKAVRAVTDRVQGCCRDHTLLSVSALRQLGFPARSRVGFASYFVPGWNADHVVVETWIGGRWVRFDPEIEAPSEAMPTPADIPAGPGAPFLTAAEVWLGHRGGSLDVSRFGVGESPAPSGDWFVFCYVIGEVAHRFGDELLLWDVWGAMSNDLASADPEAIALVDEVATLLVAADKGDRDAEAELLARYLSDPRLHPGETVRCLDPRGPEAEVLLDR
jgi:hypothetical protein